MHKMSTESERLAQAMDARRLELGLRWTDVAKRAGLTTETLRQIRQGAQEPRPLTRGGVERAMGWAAGSVEAVMAGGSPTLDSSRAVAEISDHQRRRSSWAERPDPLGLAQLTGAGSLTTASWGGSNPPPKLRDARREIADLERDLGLALDDLEDVLLEARALLAEMKGADELTELVEEAAGIVSRIDEAERAARWWRGHAEALRRDEDRIPAAARRSTEPTSAERQAEADTAIELDPP